MTVSLVLSGAPDRFYDLLNQSDKITGYGPLFGYSLIWLRMKGSQLLKKPSLSVVYQNEYLDHTDFSVFIHFHLFLCVPVSVSLSQCFFLFPSPLFICLSLPPSFCPTLFVCLLQSLHLSVLLCFCLSLFLSLFLSVSLPLYSYPKTPLISQTSILEFYRVDGCSGLGAGWGVDFVFTHSFLCFGVVVLQ